jgi:serine/threonine protein kinase
MLIGRRNEVVLSDFGIAAIAHSTSSLTAQASIGTAPYMAPEQVQAQARPASDQYTLGVVVYEWLSGERPFDGSFTEIFAKHLMTPPPPLRQKVPTLSADVEQVVLTALAKDHQQRFRSIQAFATALEDACRAPSKPPVVPAQFPSSEPTWEDTCFHPLGGCSCQRSFFLGQKQAGSLNLRESPKTVATSTEMLKYRGSPGSLYQALCSLICSRVIYTTLY